MNSSIANTTAPPVSAPPATIPVASTPAPAPAGLSLAQVNETTVTAQVYNELQDRMKVELENITKEVEKQKEEYVRFGMSLAAQEDLANTLTKNPDLINSIPEQYRPQVQTFSTQYMERKKTEPLYGAADTAVFNNASLVVGMSIATKRPHPDSDTSTITKRGTDTAGNPLATQATPVSDVGPIIARPSAPAPATLSNAATGGKPADLLSALDAGLGAIKNRNAKVGVYSGAYNVSVANYSTPANTVEYRDVRDPHGGAPRRQ